MGFSKKHQVEGDLMEGKTWVISGIAMCAPLRSVSTNKGNGGTDDDLNSGSTTPTARESRLPEKYPCPPPPAPRKRQPVSKSKKNGDIQFFTSPELDSFFENFANAQRAKSCS